jgi:hnRNP-L/PTB/hephaestus splicing factor
MSTNLPPTRVLYVRNIPDTVSDSELVQYCSPFGRVSGTLILKEKGHGFIEFESMESSSAACSYFAQNPLVLHGFHIEFTFSQRQEITPRKDPDANPPNRIILLTITNIMYPVTVDVLSQIFARYDGMEKVIIFNRGNAIQALVQLKDILTASTCRLQLDGQNIYSGCNSLKVQYSSLNELEVKQNNDRMFDFTAPLRTVANGASYYGFNRSTSNNSTSQYYGGGSLSPMGAAYQSLGSYAGGGPSPKSFGEDYVSSTGGAPVLLIENVDDSTRAEHLAALFAVYGNVVRIKMLRSRLSCALVQLHDLNQCLLCIEYLNGVMLHGRALTVSQSTGGTIPAPSKVQEEGDLDSVREFSGYPLLYSRQKPDRPQRLFLPSNTLHVSNMPDGTSEQELLQVLESHGAEVECMRFLDEQHHIAIVVCTSTENALSTLVNAHGQLCGILPAARALRIGFGHASEIADPEMLAMMGYTTSDNGIVPDETIYGEVSGMYSGYDPLTGEPVDVPDVAPGFEHLVNEEGTI